jgi:hypothetical protein
MLSKTAMACWKPSGGQRDRNQGHLKVPDCGLAEAGELDNFIEIKLLQFQVSRILYQPPPRQANSNGSHL